MATATTKPKSDTQLIRAIARRFAKLARHHDLKVKSSSVALMLTTVHAHTPLKLERLAGFDDFNLSHDVGGLWNYAHADGSIGGFFSPRCGMRIL